MQQIIVIHGGTTFQDYDKYLASLSDKKLHIDRFVYKPMWKDLLQQELGDDYQVLTPAMPNKTNARYEEWSLWFEHLSSLFDDEVILIGHSLGGIFLAKYLSERTLHVKIKATILIAAPYDDESDEDLTDFKMTSISDKLAEQAGKLVFVNGTNDPVVSQSEPLKYQKAVPSAAFISLPAPDHFMREKFPELTDLIRNTSTQE